MSTTRLPPAPEPTLLGAEVSGHVAEFYGHTDAALHAYGLAVWKAAMEAAASTIRTGDYCRYVDHTQGCCDCGEMADAIRSLPLPEQGGPQ